MGIQIRELVTWVRHRKIFASALLALTLGLGMMIGTIISGHAMATRSADPPTGATLLTIPDPVNLSNGFSNIVTRVEPAVVNISTTQIFEAPKGRGKNGTPQGLQDFFNKFFNQNPNQGQGQDAERSLGSGVIVDKNGYILTNDHVIDGATKIQVAMDGDATKYTAKVIGIDKQTDLAVIKIDTSRQLPTARLGNSDGTKVGDWVLAFGSPFQLNGTVTSGIISAKNRQYIGNTQFQNFIQTDAAINPGNSGGPLVNLAGEVIGINTAIYTGSRGFEGVGFALPSNTAINVYNQLVTQGHVTRGSIGVKFQEDQTVNPLLHKELGVANGVVVQWVAPGSPAAKVGIQAGDVITHINGKPVQVGADLINPIVQTAIGHTVQLTYFRKGKSTNANVMVADMDKTFPDQAANEDNDPGGVSAEVEPAPVTFGLHVQQLTPEVSRHLGMSASQTGVLVSEVDPASFAEDINFHQGEVIVEINHDPVTDMTSYKNAIARLKPGEDVLFKVMYGDGTGQVYTVFHTGTIPRAGQ